MTDRLHSCKHSPDGRHRIGRLSRCCDFCNRTQSYLSDVGWNVPAHDPDTFMAADAPYVHAFTGAPPAAPWQDEEADVNDAPRRALDSERDCVEGSTGPWLCERPNGHSGPHMAWSDFPNRVLYEGGVWD